MSQQESSPSDSQVGCASGSSALATGLGLAEYSCVPKEMNTFRSSCQSIGTYWDPIFSLPCRKHGLSCCISKNGWSNPPFLVVSFQQGRCSSQSPWDVGRATKQPAGAPDLFTLGSTHATSCQSSFLVARC